MISAVGDPLTTATYKRILSILDSKDKIPSLYRIGGADGSFYNYWQDNVHVQGIWRKTTLASYKSGSPEWHTVIDVDALPPPQCDTAKTWVWHGSTLLDDGPGTVCDRAIIALSPGGSDADTRREFDLATEKWVEATDGGFAMPTAAKTQLTWRSRDELLVGTDFGGDGKCLTDSGYPRVVKSWKRGTPIEEAKVVFEGEQTDVAASQYAYHDRGYVHEFQLRSITFWTSKFWYRKLSQEGIRSTSADADTSPFVEVKIPGVVKMDALTQRNTHTHTHTHTRKPTTHWATHTHIHTHTHTHTHTQVKIPEDAEIGTFANAALVSLRSDWQPPGCGTTE